MKAKPQQLYLKHQIVNLPRDQKNAEVSILFFHFLLPQASVRLAAKAAAWPSWRRSSIVVADPTATITN
jgi:hypothetical protein